MPPPRLFSHIAVGLAGSLDTLYPVLPNLQDNACGVADLNAALYLYRLPCATTFLCLRVYIETAVPRGTKK